MDGQFLASQNDDDDDDNDDNNFKLNRGGVELQLYSFLNLGAIRGGWSTPRAGHFIAGKDPIPIVQEAGWAPGPVWTGAENLELTGIRSPDRS